LPAPASNGDTATWLPLDSQASQATDEGEPARDAAAETELGGAQDSDVPLAPSSQAGQPPQRRPARLIASALAVALVAGGACLLAVRPWATARQPVAPPRAQPVLQPTGLIIAGRNASSLTVDWSGPATGPRPDRYEVLRGDVLIATVPGTVTSYTDSGLTPDSVNRYQVIAVRAGKLSPASRQLAGQTAVPPLAAARFAWGGLVTVNMLSLSPSNAQWDIQPGRSWTEPWRFTPECSSGPCNVLLSGVWDGASFTSTLTRSGDAYSGTASIDLYSCDDQGNLTLPTLTITIKVNSAVLTRAQWIAKTFSGTFTYSQSRSACTAETSQNTVSDPG
jgi:hypothetical protein